MKVQLGRKYRDMVTGIEGVCTEHTRFLTGCDRAGLTWPNEDKTEIHQLCFDVTQLVEVEALKIVIDLKPGMDAVG